MRHIKRIAARNLKISSIHQNINNENNIINKFSDDFGFNFTIHDINEELLYRSETIYSNVCIV